MAVEAVVALMEDKLGKLLSNEEAQLLGVRGEIERIRVELNQMRRFLKDADIRQKEDEHVRNWMEDIRDICFDVDDVIDILGQGQAAHGSLGFVKRLITRYKVGKAIKQIKLNITDVSKSRESYGKRKIVEERPEATSSTQHLQEVKRWSVPAEKKEIVIPIVDDQLTNEERTWDMDGVSQEAGSSSRNLQAHRQVSTLPGEPEEVGLQEEINTVGQHLIEEEPRLWDGTRDISEGKLEASSSTPGLKADRRFSTLLGDSEEVGLQEGINRMGQQLIKEEPWPYGGTRDIDEGRLEASSSAPCLQADRQFSTLLRESEEVGLQEEIYTVSQQLIKEEPCPSDGTRDIDEGRPEASPSRQSLQDRRQFSAVLEGLEIVGQQEEISTLKKQLVNEEQRRCVISLVGMGGSGKTTLARKVYHDVKNDFDCHAFICLSQHYEMKEVLIRLITCAMSKLRREIKNLTEEELEMMLHEHLKGRRYLVVIDDIWSTEAWNYLELILPDTGKSKSRVMLTTCSRDVALHADHHHEMRLLNDDESWKLFMKKIFPKEDPSTACPSNLEETGRKILTKCGRLPLAILVLGGLLATKDKTDRAWSKVLESIPESSKQCLEILALSYWDLPHYLKPCFLYVGLFPEDYEISSGKLIRLWIAEGFIQQKGNKVIEDAAEDYLEELVSRSMIQVASKRSNGSIRKCRIHHLLLELSINEARQNNFFAVHIDNDTSSSSTSVRRLGVYCNIDWNETKNHSIENLRSILYFFDSGVDVLNLPNTSSKLLRVLNVESEKISEVSLPKEVGEFVHLKFLEFSPSYCIRSIPPSIGNVSSLQTLRVFTGPAKVNFLPNTIWNLKELRHLHANAHIEGHPHLSNLTNLQTLSLRAGSWIEEGLGKLTNLRKLKIHTDLSSYHATLPYCIEKLRNLRSLQLEEDRIWTDRLPPFPRFLPFTHHQDLYKIYLTVCIQKLPELPPNLVELYLEGSELEQDAISTLEKLQHLKILKLFPRSYLGKRMICSQGGFPQLEFLELNNLPIEEWIVEDFAMISLKSVELFAMSPLKIVLFPSESVLS